MGKLSTALPCLHCAAAANRQRLLAAPPPSPEERSDASVHQQRSGMPAASVLTRCRGRAARACARPAATRCTRARAGGGTPPRGARPPRGCGGRAPCRTTSGRWAPWPSVERVVLVFVGREASEAAMWRTVRVAQRVRTARRRWADGASRFCAHTLRTMAGRFRATRFSRIRRVHGPGAAAGGRGEERKKQRDGVSRQAILTRPHFAPNPMAPDAPRRSPRGPGKLESGAASCLGRGDG